METRKEEKQISSLSRIASGITYIIPVILRLILYFGKGITSIYIPTGISVFVAFIIFLILQDSNRRFWIYHLSRSIFIWLLLLIFIGTIYIEIAASILALICCLIAIKGEKKTIFSYILPPKESKSFTENNGTGPTVQNASARDKLLAQMKHKQ